ncbi:uncharacterized protein [Malus domestica]|uniref:uncharacterized protein n=1 Tax=Malus domestica TaxID=3750 RepID=UPI00397557E0
MSNLNKLDFSTLEVSGRNYLKWVQYVKLHLTAKGIRATIKTPIADKPVDKAQKATAMIFIRRHIHDALQTEYLIEEDPHTLWLALADRFDHQKDIYLPEAKHNWQHLHFHDFKSVNEYNSEVCRIHSLLKFCKVELTKSDLLKKTYLIFHATNIVMQQQYRAQKFTKFSDLISVLLLIEKKNQVLMKNHQSQPTGLNATPEAHATYSSSHKQQKNHHGRGNRWQAPP